MAGTGTAHLRDADDDAAARRGPRRRVPGRPHRAQGATPCPTSASTCCQGETLGLVGESGCGKSTTGRAIMQLPPPDVGLGACSRAHDLTDAARARSCAERAPQLQMIFQDPISSLNPRRKVERHRRRGPATSGSVGDAGAQQRQGRRGARGRRPRPATRRASAGRTSSPAASASASRSPARSSLDPKLIICDEPVSALDVSVQAQILNLLEDMKARYGLTLIFIAHDLAVVKNVSDRVAVMYLGKLCEVGAARRALRAARAPVHRGAARRDPGARSRRRRPTERTRSRARSRRRSRPPSGCRFRTRCPQAAGRAAPTRSRRSARSARTTSSPATSRSTPGEADRVR